MKKGNYVKMIIKWIIKLLVWVPPILIAIIIFGYSSQGGVESSSLSNRVATSVIHIADKLNIADINDNNIEKLIENLQYPIRKGAHMMEYMVLTLSVILALYVWNVRKKWLYLVAFIIAVLFSCSDEFHQLFVSGRSGRLMDVLIDSIGAGIGVLIVWYTSRIKSKK